MILLYNEIGDNMHKRYNLTNMDSNLLYISKTTIEQGLLTNLHSHPNLEILLITERSGIIVTTNKRIDVKCNDIVIINSNCNHCEINSGLSFYAIGLKNTNIYLSETYTKKVIVNSLNNKNYTFIKNCFDLIYEEAKHQHDSSSYVVFHTFSVIMTLLERSFNFIVSNNNTKESDLVNSIKSIIDSFYQTDIKLSDISHRLSSSVSTISHIFKKETNMTIFEYKIKKQLEEACNLLTLTDMKICDICSLVGFSDSSYFSKMFYRHYKQTPKEYRKKGR